MIHAIRFEHSDYRRNLITDAIEQIYALTALLSSSSKSATCGFKGYHKAIMNKSAIDQFREESAKHALLAVT